MQLSTKSFSEESSSVAAVKEEPPDETNQTSSAALADDAGSLRSFATTEDNVIGSASPPYVPPSQPCFPMSGGFDDLTPAGYVINLFD